MSTIQKLSLVKYTAPILTVLLITWVFLLTPSPFNVTTVALSFLLCVMVVATFAGRNPALVASFVAMLCFNYFFLPPVRTWHIADSQNFIAWGSFTITAMVIGELSAYAHRRRQQAELQKSEIARLYSELQEAFERASETEALKRSEKLKVSLIDALSHDLKTPLTSIKAAATTLLESEGGHRTIELDSDSRIDFLETIDQEADRLNDFIESMVGLARIESNALRGVERSADVSEALSAAIKRAEKRLCERVLEIQIPNDLPPLGIDEKALSEIFYVLIDNAAKYSIDGSKIRISAYATADSVKFEIDDEGVGISPEDRIRVFEKFFRGQSPDSPGLGIGLTIAKNMVEALSGRIWIEGKGEKQGTKVLFTIQT